MKKLLLSLFLFSTLISYAQKHFSPLDVYDLEFATDPNFSPNGQQIVYARSFMDVMTDRRLSNLWTIDPNGKNHRPLTSGNHNDYNPIWSPDGSKLAYLSNESGATQIHMLWLDNGRSSKITNLQTGVSNLCWSPDGKHLAFTMRIKKENKPFGNMPQKPKGAKWATPPVYIDDLLYRADGAGFLEESYNHVFVLPIEGGTPRQITDGDFNHNNPQWSKDGNTIICSANRMKDWEYDRQNTEIFTVDIKSKKVKALTDRKGPDRSPRLSPDGTKIAYLGYDDKKMGYHHEQLYIMDIDGKIEKLYLKH